MDFDESLFAAAIGTAVNSDSNAAAQQTLHEALDEGAVKSDNTTMHKQAFYPTPNSSNMHATATEKQFMSPFLANYQNYPNITSENGFAELDELLFTPMLSPAMTPMNHYQGRQTQPEVDWENFDKNMFALTGAAIESIDPQAFQLNTETGQPLKKQRIAADNSSKASRHTSPTTSSAAAESRSRSAFLRKRNNSMAAPIAKPFSDKSSSSIEASDEFSPVDLEQFSGQEGMVYQNEPNISGAAQIQPITPSMLMSLQNTSEDIMGGHDGASDSIDFSMSGRSTRTNSISTPMMPAFPMPLPTTPRVPANMSQREVRGRPIALAHAKSKSVNSSPALGPQRCRPSPDIRPILPGGMSPQVGAMLASKSNYQHIVDGTYDQLNITYPQGMTHGLEVRRTSHKAAEQKRRDHLKECFELMRTILPDRPEPGASKVAILKKGYEHILQLKAMMKEKDAKIAQLEAAIKNQE